MLSKRLIQVYGLRVKFMSYSDATFYLWDKEKEQLVSAGAGRLFGMFHAISACYVGSFALLSRIYWTLTFKDIPDVAEKHEDPYKFLTLIMAYCEVCLIMCIAFLIKNTLDKRDVLMYLMNQLLDYSKKLGEMMERGELTLGAEQKLIIKVGETSIYLVCGLSLILPFGLVAVATVPFEPIHALLKVLVEVDFGFTWGFSPLILIMTIAMFNCANTVCLCTVVISLYYLICIVCMTGIGMTPNEEVQPMLGKPRRCQLQTNCFGELDDESVVQLYRIQQIFSVLMGAVFKSVFIAFHHVGLLTTMCVSLCFVLRYGDVLKEEGFAAYMIIFGILFAVLAMIFFQTRMGGEIVDVSSDFKATGVKIVRERYLFRKFLSSCQTFSLPVTYPFYTVGTDTFLSFCQQSVDNTLTLLFW